MSRPLSPSITTNSRLIRSSVTAVSKESLLDNAKVLLVEGGSLDRVREWTGNGDWENRVSSLTAANVEFLKSESSSGSFAWFQDNVLMIAMLGIGAWQYIESSRSCPVQEMLVSYLYLYLDLE